MAVTPQDVVVVSRPHDGIAQLTLNRPDKLNAMTTELVQALHEHARRDRPSTRRAE